jgi:hypothetical protein
MHDQLGCDQDRKGYQKFDMYFCVLKKGNSASAAHDRAQAS